MNSCNKKTKRTSRSFCSAFDSVSFRYVSCTAQHLLFSAIVFGVFLIFDLSNNSVDSSTTSATPCFLYVIERMKFVFVLNGKSHTYAHTLWQYCCKWFFYYNVFHTIKGEGKYVLKLSKGQTWCMDLSVEEILNSKEN